MRAQPPAAPRRAAIHFGLHFPKLDADLYLPAILEGFLAPARSCASSGEKKMPTPVESVDLSMISTPKPSFQRADKYDGAPLNL
jgi:hypothetical protein